MGDREGAARDAAEAVIADPADPEAKAILGAALLDLGRIADAVACLARSGGRRAAPIPATGRLWPRAGDEPATPTPRCGS